MSVINFELKEEHVKLLKNLKWSINKDNILSGVANEGDELAPPFGESNFYEAVALILLGKPNDIDPFTYEDMPVYTAEQQAEWDKLYAELPLALDVILFNGSFETGLYKTRFYDRNWKKLN